MREPNSHECIYFGRKLSNTDTDIEVTPKDYDAVVTIGSECDDEIYFPPVLKDGEEMLKERVKMYLEADTQNDEIHVFEVDLEDVLMFAAKNCAGIYKRVYEDSQK
jgi:hypothetical protein